MEYRVDGGGVVLYNAYAADVNLDSSALKDAGVDCSTTWDGSEFQSPTVCTQKSGGMLVLKNRYVFTLNIS